MRLAISCAWAAAREVRSIGDGIAALETRLNRPGTGPQEQCQDDQDTDRRAFTS